MGIRHTIIRDIEKAEHELREMEQKCPGEPELQTSVMDAQERVATGIERILCYDYKAYLVRTHAEGD
ncbi:hypothetical protein NDU88_000962 [Pleurodeles waltl]|uniref:Uncharacterized protein n=1 Tax=Pleurodeles waltl TaxID=8319 RepID=A0AAV7USX4_PLEWA|nr:hypothetical protein NDU88_000962 [Pleurodeles waltl]